MTPPTRTCRPRVGEDDGSGDTNSTAQAHDGRESALADERGRDALPVEHQTGTDGADCRTVEPVGGAGEAQDAREMSLLLVSTCAQWIEDSYRGQLSRTAVEGVGGIRVIVDELQRVSLGTHCARCSAAIAYWVLSVGDLVRHNGLVPDSGVLRRHCGCWRAASGCGGLERGVRLRLRARALAQRHRSRSASKVDAKLARP